MQSEKNNPKTLEFKTVVVMWENSQSLEDVFFKINDIYMIFIYLFSSQVFIIL